MVGGDLYDSKIRSQIVILLGNDPSAALGLVPEHPGFSLLRVSMNTIH